MAKPIPSLKKPSVSIPVSAMASFVDDEDGIKRTTDESPAPAPHEPETPTPLSLVADAAAPATDAATPSEPRRRPKRNPGRRLESRKDGSVTRKVTFYLAPDLDKQLSIYALTQGVDRSEVVSELLARFLKKAS